MHIHRLRERVHACWLGKAIGGTLGAPHEGKPGPLKLEFYDPVPTGCLPNDDLDLQVVWLHHLRATKAHKVTPELLADAWQKHVLFCYDEYGIARRNRAWGLSGAAQGATDNFFGECMGAAIRSEIWACLAPGDPARAAAFACADAVVDHAGDGVWAEVFHAALQSAAFVETDRERLLQIALAFLPADSRLKLALIDTRGWLADGLDWLEVRNRVIERYYPGNFTDVVCNLCFELIGWHFGGGDFGRAILIATNCGQDTDCTAATLGALLGILDPHCIPERWVQPIGQHIVLSAEIVGFTPPADLTELTEWTLEVAANLADEHPSIVTPLPRVAGNGGRFAPRATVVDARRAPENAVPKPSGEKISLGGFWSQWRREDFASDVKHISLDFTLKQDGGVKLMLHYMAHARAWVDGRLVFTAQPDELAVETFAAPSFHRVPLTTCVIPVLAAGPHSLVIELAPPAHGHVCDLIFGLADPTSNLWLPDAFLAAETV